MTAKHLFNVADKVLIDLNYVAPEDLEMRRTKVVNQLMYTCEPLYAIHRELDGRAWDADTLDRVADILLAAGFEIREPKD